jgi:hypothetical protein
MTKAIVAAAPAAPSSGLNLPLKLVDVIIEGTRPLLMHRISDAAMYALEHKGGKKIPTVNKPPREVAYDALYYDAEGGLYFPGTAILRMLAEAGSGEKQTGTRKGLKWIIGGGTLPPEFIQIHVPAYAADGRWNGIDWRPARVKDSDGSYQDWDIDTRTARNQVNKARIVVHRPRVSYWQGHFSFVVNEDVIDTQTIHRLLGTAGTTQGLGSFRPSNLGCMGTFKVNEYKVRANYAVPVHQAPTFDPAKIRPAAHAK